jgi:hypothetical protein
MLRRFVPESAFDKSESSMGCRSERAALSEFVAKLAKHEHTNDPKAVE